MKKLILIVFVTFLVASNFVCDGDKKEDSKKDVKGTTKTDSPSTQIQTPNQSEWIPFSFDGTGNISIVSNTSTKDTLYVLINLEVTEGIVTLGGIVPMNFTPENNSKNRACILSIGLGNGSDKPATINLSAQNGATGKYKVISVFKK